MSRSTAAQFTCDHLLRGRRGVKRCSQNAPASDRAWPSIHPKQSAASSASARETEVAPPPFRASRSQTPGADA
jgi:hypothetical protein